MRHIMRPGGRFIGAQFLRFWVAVGLGACAPAIPGTGPAPNLAPATRDAGTGGSAGVGMPARAPTGTQPTVGAPTGPPPDAASGPLTDARGDATNDVARGDAALTVSRADAGADVSSADADTEAGDRDARSIDDVATTE